MPVVITRTHNGYHLGDNLVHLHFLRKVALANPDRQFIHAAQWQYIRQLQDVITDVPNIKLEEFGYRTPSDSIDSWRGAGGFWYQHPNRNDFVTFHIKAWFPYLADRMGVENPVTKRKDMLFDYPEILNQVMEATEQFDALIINAQPGSGQFTAYNRYRLRDVILRMNDKGWKIVISNDFEALDEYPPANRPICTERLGLSVTQVGNLSLHCHTIIMVSTGPSWPTFNVWNQDSIKLRIILLEPERVNLAPNTVHCATIDEAEKVLKEAGLL